MSALTIAEMLRKVPKLAGDPHDKRWSRASLLLRGSDGESREEFFSLPVEERIGLVHERMVTRAPWKPLIQVDIPKTHAAGKTRPICWCTNLDTALTYLLADELTEYGESVLSDACIAYRLQRALDRSIRRAIQEMRERGLYCVCVIDIRSFFDSIPWRRLDAVIDSLPGDADVKSLLKQLVRVRVQRLDGSVVERQAGIPQGLPVSPMLANLALSAFDRKLTKKLARLGVIYRRYADDVLLAASDLHGLEKARQIVQDQLRWEGLAVKDGTGECVDLRIGGTRARWLGIELSTISGPKGQPMLILDVPQTTVEEKATAPREELEAGVITVEEAERRLASLKRYYLAILSEQRAEEIIQSVHGRMLSLTGRNPIQTMDHLLKLHGLGERRKENRSKTIDQLIHRSHATKRNMHPSHGCKLDGEEDDRARVHSHGGKNLGGIRDARYGSTDSSPGRQDLEGSRGTVRAQTVAGEGVSQTATRTPDVLRPRKEDEEDFLQLPLTDGLAPSPWERDGVPALGSHPARHRKTAIVHVEPRGAHACKVSVSGTIEWETIVTDSTCTSAAEMVLVGFTRSIELLRMRGISRVVLTTTEPTIVGYVERGWRMGSFALLRRLRRLQEASAAVEVVFEPVEIWPVGRCRGGEGRASGKTKKGPRSWQP